ncbi:MAG: hypothetical protein WBD07_00805 [Vicinamibacterales bacterium]
MSRTSGTRNRERKDALPWVPIGIVALAVYAALLLGGYSLRSWVDTNKLGTVGDFFGGMANIVAMAGVIIALVMQKQELMYQRWELEDNREVLEQQKVELARQATFMGEQVAALKQANTAQNLVIVNKLMLDFRPDRKYLIESLSAKPYSTWDDNDKEVARRTLAQWNSVAVLISEFGVPATVLDQMRYTVCKCRDVASPYLKEVLRLESQAHWRSFRDLADKLCGGNPPTRA